MTTNDIRSKMTSRVIGLMDRARHASTPELEAAACREKAEQIVSKYELSATLLTEPTANRPSAARRPSPTPPQRTYPCRFGCGVMVQHTPDEMSECAARKREREGTDSAYDIPKGYRRRDPIDDFLNDFFGRGYAYTHPGAGHREHASWTRPPGQARTGSEKPAGEPKPRRRQTSHAFCDHEPTKAARAHCRKMGGPRF